MGDCRFVSKMAKRRAPVNEEVRRFQRLLDPKVSLERVWYELNARPGTAAQSTVDALKYSLHRGPDALADPNTLRRLSELSDEQLLHAVAVDLQKFKPEFAPAWTREQIEVLAAVRRKL